MLVLLKLVLGPLLLLQGKWLRRTALRLPEADGPRCGTTGPDTGTPLRLLFIGDSATAGVGVPHQSQAMPQQAAALAARSLQRPVHWRVLARSGIDTREAQQLLARQATGPADIIIAALGVNDTTGQISARQFVADYQRLLQTTRQQTGARLAIVFGLPAMDQFAAIPQPLRWYLGRYAGYLDQALQTGCDKLAGVRFVTLAFEQPQQMAQDGYHPGPQQHQQWAARVADEINNMMRLTQR